MEKEEINTDDPLCSFVGLFWFSNDYSSITEEKGLVKFGSKDVETKKTVIPNGTHASFKSRRFTTPRGRVELNEGVPTIFVGDNCPDSAIDIVIELMRLKQYKEIINIRRSSFWDKK